MIIDKGNDKTNTANAKMGSTVDADTLETKNLIKKYRRSNEIPEETGR